MDLDGDDRLFFGFRILRVVELTYSWIHRKEIRKLFSAYEMSFKLRKIIKWLSNNNKKSNIHINLEIY